MLYEKEPLVKERIIKELIVPIRCFKEAKICELVDSIILSNLSNVLEIKNVKINSDEWLCVMKQIPGPKSDYDTNESLCS